MINPPTCYANFSSASQVKVWETVWVQGVDLTTMSAGLHPATLLDDDREECWDKRRKEVGPESK